MSVQNLKLTFEVDGKSTLVRYLEYGKTKTKVIATQDLPSIFNNKTMYDTGALSVIGKNVIGIHRVIDKGNKLYVFVVGQELIRNIDGYRNNYK